MATVPGSDNVLYMKGRSLYAGKLGSSPASLEKAVDLSDMVAPIDYAQEWAQIFDEAWRAYRDGFYVETMHGVD